MERGTPIFQESFGFVSLDPPIPNYRGGPIQRGRIISHLVKAALGSKTLMTDTSLRACHLLYFFSASSLSISYQSS